MAYETRVDTGATDTFHHPFDAPKDTPDNRLTTLANVLAAVISVALIVGVCVWGYKLMMRDVTGIPIVRATGGDMRERPKDPGGQLAEHQGLSVNVVAAEGSAEAPSQKIVLAPQPVHLTDEDMPINPDAVAIVQQAIAEQSVITGETPPGEAVLVAPSRVAEAAESGSVEALVAVLTEDAPSQVGGDDTAVHLAQANGTTQDAIQSALMVALATEDDVPGLRASLRPQLRPAQLAVVTPAAVLSVPAVRDINPLSLPTGTRLVQLGAYDSAEEARADWAQFADRFTDLMAGKDRVVQEASSGGRSFYRLRAVGFQDLADARRFCSVLLAGGADCIPVVTR